MSAPSRFAPAGALGLGGLLALALASFLFTASFERTARPPLHAVLLDASPSVVRTRPDLAATWTAIADAERERARRRGAELCFVSFDADVLELGPSIALRPPVAPGAPPAPGGDARAATRLDRALAAIEPRLVDPERPPGELALVGDGTFTDVDPSPLLARLAARGVAIRLLELDPGRPDRALGDLRLPPSAAPGEALAATVAVRAPADLPSVDLEFVVGERSGRVTAPLDRGSGGARATVALGPMPSTPVRVAIELADSADPVPENDRVAGLVRPAEAPLALVFGPGHASVVDALGRAGFEVVAANEPGEPDGLLGRLADARLIVECEPRAGEADALVAAFVAGGGGWLGLAGPRTLEGSPADRWPLAFGPDDDGARDVVLCVDASGSMAGEPYERALAVARALAERAPPGDRVRFAAFAAELEPERPIGAANAARVVADLFAERPPSGPTDLVGVVDELLARAAGSPQGRLVFVLTDGRDEVGRAPADPEDLRARLAAARTRLVPVAIGAAADPGGLARSVPSEPVRRTRNPNDPNELVELLLGEVRAERVRRGPLTVLALDPGGVWTELGRALGGALPLDVATLARARAERAEPVAVTADGGIVGAIGRRGAGRVAGLATGGGAWSDDARELGAVVAALAHAVLSEAPRPRLDARAGELVAGGLEDAPPIVELRLRGPDGAAYGPYELTIPSVALGPDPRPWRTAPWPADLPTSGPVLVGEVTGPGAAGELAAPVWLARPPSEEFRWPPRALDPPPPPAAAGPARGPHPAAPWTLGLGLLLTTVAAWVRFRS